MNSKFFEKKERLIAFPECMKNGPPLSPRTAMYSAMIFTGQKDEGIARNMCVDDNLLKLTIRRPKKKASVSIAPNKLAE